MDTLYELILFWFFVIGLFSVLVTVMDKSNAIRHKQRVPESTLLLLGLIGGAPVMLATMLFIKHKIRHLKFMLLLPVFMLLQSVLLFWAYYNLS